MPSAVRKALPKLDRVAKALSGILGEGAREEEIEDRRRLRNERAYRRWRRVDLVPPDEELTAVGRERRPTGEHPVENDRGGVEVTSAVERQRAHLLRGHVSPRPRSKLGRGRQRGRADEARHAEITELHEAVATNQDIRRLDVAVNDPHRVNGRERSEQLLEIVPGAQERHARQAAARELCARSVARDGGLEHFAVDVFHRENERTVVLEQATVRDDVRVRKASERFGLPQKELSRTLLREGLRAQHFQRDRLDLAREWSPRRVKHEGPPNDAHAPFTDARVDDEPRVPALES